jgi:predicted ATPase
MLSGKAGIGKSRVLRTFCEKIADQPHSRAVFHDSAHHRNSALYRVIDQFERALRFESNDSVEPRLEKLQSEINRPGLEMESTVPPLVALLSMDKDAKPPGVFQSEELKGRQHVGTVGQYHCQKLHDNCCLPSNLVILLQLNLGGSDRKRHRLA